MAPNEEIKQDVEQGTDEAAEQAEIAWAKDLMEEFKPEGIEEEGNGEVVEDAVDDETPAEDETKTEDEPEAKDETDTVDTDAIGEADYSRKVAIKNEDDSISYKTVKQLLDDGMLDADYRKKTTDIARQRDHLKEDQSILSLLDSNDHARKYLLQMIDDVKSGKGPVEDDIGFSDEVLEQLPGLKKLVNKVKEHDVEVRKYRNTQEQTRADQTVGKIDSVMKAAQTAIEKETGSKLEPGVFRARVGKGIFASLDVPDDNKVSVAGQLILADKDYFLSKARTAFQQEIELAKDKAITAAKQERKQAQQKTKSIKGGGAVAVAGQGDLKVTMGKDGRPDMDAFLEKAFKDGPKRV